MQTKEELEDKVDDEEKKMCVFCTKKSRHRTKVNCKYVQRNLVKAENKSEPAFMVVDYS